MPFGDFSQAGQVHYGQTGNVSIGEANKNVGALDGQVPLLPRLLRHVSPNLFKSHPPGRVTKVLFESSEPGVKLLKLLVNGNMSGLGGSDQRREGVLEGGKVSIAF